MWRLKELDLLAVIVASIIGLILHVLGMMPEAYVISLILFLLCLHAIHETRHSMKYDEAHEKILNIERKIEKASPEIELISKEHFSRGEEIALRNRGEMWWFNAPLAVLHTQEAFDKLLKPAIENPRTKKIEFVLKPEIKEFWEKEVQPKIDKCKGREKVSPPVWRDIEENVAFKMIDLSEKEEIKEAHVTFWGEPFTMERGTEEVFPKVYHPRYILYVRSHSELIPRLKELFMKYRMKGES